jgi:hypothetical protein
MIAIKKNKQKENFQKAVILLKTVREGILAEKAIIKKGIYAKKVAPPQEYRKGCEIAVEIKKDEKDIAEKILMKYNIDYEGIISL